MLNSRISLLLKDKIDIIRSKNEEIAELKEQIECLEANLEISQRFLALSKQLRAKGL